LENKLLKQAPPIGFSLTLVRGLPGRQEQPDFGPGIKVFNHLPGPELNRLICESGMIICRAGYSSIMELLGLAKKCILIPTPGQTEQEYLAEELFRKKLAFRVRQDEFEWKKCLEQAAAFPFASYEEEEPGLLEAAIRELLARL
jgi:UDP-N-acetylglucosamine:LPS N-acetylglucosamine transferase